MARKNLDEKKERYDAALNVINIDEITKYDREMQRANLVSQASLEVDRKAHGYEIYTHNANNPLNAVIHESFIDELNKFAFDSHDSQLKTAQNTAELVEILKQIMEVK